MEYSLNPIHILSSTNCKYLPLKKISDLGTQDVSEALTLIDCYEEAERDLARSRLPGWRNDNHSCCGPNPEFWRDQIRDFMAVHQIADGEMCGIRMSPEERLTILDEVRKKEVQEDRRMNPEIDQILAKNPSLVDLAQEIICLRAKLAHAHKENRALENEIA